MPVIFRCSGCEEHLSISSKFIGRRIRCPHCEEIERVPDPRQKAEEKKERRERKKAAAEAVKPRPEKRPEDGGELKPRRRRKKKSRMPDSNFDSAIVEAAGIEINCFCGFNHKIDPELAGTRLECDCCGRMMSVPDPAMMDGIHVDLAPLEDDDDEVCPFCGARTPNAKSRCRACGKSLTRSRKYK